jgi:spore cortex formation protein SpoVR/YcgB (stage V sporulation)
MRVIQLIGNKIQNVIIADSLDLPFEGTFIKDTSNEQTGYAQSGGYFIDGKFYPPRPTNEEQAENRRYAYEKEADPIFFMIQRGEATQEEWEAKVAEIKERYPYYFDDEGNLLEAM